MTNVFGITARAYQWYEDGTEAGAAALASENTSYDLLVISDAPIVLRYGVQESGSGSASGASTDDYQLQYSLNGGAFTNVTAASTVVQGFTSANLTDAAATTQRLSAGTGSFVAGEIAETDGLLTDWALTANNFSELLFAIQVLAADTAEDDSITFRVLRNGAVFNTYSVTPTLTVTVIPPEIVGTLSVTLGNATLSSTGVVDVNGTLSKTLDAAALSSTGVVDVNGTLSKTLDDATLVATGTAEQGGVNGEVSQTLGNATLSSAGVVDVNGTLSKTLDAATLSSTGVVDVNGAVSQTLGNATLAATGVVDVNGAVTATLGNATLAATGSVEDRGTVTQTLGNATLSSSGSVEVRGSLSTSLAGASLAAEGVVGDPPVEGVLNATLGPATLVSTGSVEVRGEVNTQLAGLGLTATGSVEVSGAVARTLANATLTSSGSVGEPVVIPGDPTSTVECHHATSGSTSVHVISFVEVP